MTKREHGTGTYLHASLRAVCVSLCLLALFVAVRAEAATLTLSPETGVYQVGGTWTSRVVVNTAGKPINAAEGTITYDPKQLQVVGVSKGASIFNLWTIEPTYSSGKITFGGGSPSGYTGANGTVMTITWKGLAAGTPKASFSAGSVLAADGLGTNVLTSMRGGTYTVSAAAATPEPEYVAPANTPGAPSVRSGTHPDPTLWYTGATAQLSWDVPSGVTAVRTLLDSSKGTVPTNVYEPPIKEREITELSGESYFHIQFKNADGWGKVTHFRLAVDATRPESFNITLEDGDVTNPKKQLRFDAKDTISGIAHYLVQIDGGERTKWIDEKKDGRYELPHLPPGEHTVVVEAIDYAGNGLVSSISFTIDAFDAPVITDYPTEITERIIPVVTGTTRPNAKVYVTLTRTNATESETLRSEKEVTADGEGKFVYVADGRLALGTYEVIARAVDTAGAQSKASAPVSIAVQESGVKRVGTTLITLLSVAIPLIALIVLLILVVLHGRNRFRALRARVGKEADEAAESLARELGAVTDDLAAHIETLKDGKQGKMTRAELALLNSVAKEIESARTRIAKEIDDIERIVRRR
jgi:5-hydroxyisourate hydrolase-like protein (transthyretin family)